MSMTYTISDPTVPADYQAVLQPGALIAGPLAETPRVGRLDQDALNWLKANFYKAELELGHCLRLSQEGPCECDLYLTLRQVHHHTPVRPRTARTPQRRMQLAADARTRGWNREIDRHQRIADRIHCFVARLREDTEQAPGGQPACLCRCCQSSGGR